MSKLFLGLLGNCGIPSVFDHVVGSVWHMGGNLGPTVAVLLVEEHQLVIFFWSPWALVDVRIEVVDPPLAALLTDSSWKHLGQLSPRLAAVCVNKFDDNLVFLAAPTSLQE